MVDSCDCLRAGERERTYLSSSCSLGKLLHENGFLSWPESLEANMWLEVKELSNEQVPGAGTSSSAVSPQTVQPWTRSSLLVAFAVLSVAQGAEIPSFHLLCLGWSFNLQHSTFSEEFGHSYRHFSHTVAMQMSLVDSAEAIPNCGHRHLSTGFNLELKYPS